MGSQIAKFDHEISAKGTLAIRENLERIGIKLITEMSPQTQQSLLADPVILIATHPNLLDIGGVIGAIPEERKDIYILGNSLYLGLGEFAKAHLIPVYGVNQQETNNLRSRLWRKTGFEINSHTPAQAAKLNMRSLRLAGQKVKEGGLIVIFPEGSKEKGGKWFEGVGILVENLKSNPNVKIIFASVSGNQTRDMLRPFRGVSSLLGKKEVRVKFSEPYLVNQFVTPENTRQSITSNLQNQYQVFKHS